MTHLSLNCKIIGLMMLVQHLATSPYGYEYKKATSDYCTSFTKTLIYCALIAVGAQFPACNKCPCGNQ